MRRVPLHSPVLGMTLLAVPAADDAPDEGGAGARVEPAGQRGRDVGDDLGERVGEVLGELRPRGVPAAAGEVRPGCGRRRR